MTSGTKIDAKLKADIIKQCRKLHASQSKDYGNLQQKLIADLSSYVSQSMLGTIRSEIMRPALNSSLAKLSQLVTDGIARTAEEFASSAEQRLRAVEVKIAQDSDHGREAIEQRQAEGVDKSTATGKEEKKKPQPKAKPKAKLPPADKTQPQPAKEQKAGVPASKTGSSSCVVLPTPVSATDLTLSAISSPPPSSGSSSSSRSSSSSTGKSSSASSGISLVSTANAAGVGNVALAVGADLSLLPAVALVRAGLPIARGALPAAGGIGLLAVQYQAGQESAQKIQLWNSMAANGSRQITPSGVDYALVSSVMPDLDLSNPHDREIAEHLARGAALARAGQVGGATSSSSSKVGASAIASSNSDNQESGICKASHPYDPSETAQKEPWMHKHKIAGKNKPLLDGIPLYGLNPGNFQRENDVIRVDTELPGGDAAARECFKNLTGVEVPLVLIDEKFGVTAPDGTYYQYRRLGDSGHPKVDINASNSTTLVRRHEKITFK